MLGDNTKGGNRNLSGRFDESARPIVAVDVEKYQAYLDDPNLSEEQKEEFLQAIWSIMVAFVDLGFGVHPLQEVCGQDSDESCPRAKEGFNKVKSEPLDEPENV